MQSVNSLLIIKQEQATDKEQSLQNTSVFLAAVTHLWKSCPTIFKAILFIRVLTLLTLPSRNIPKYSTFNTTSYWRSFDLVEPDCLSRL